MVLVLMGLTALIFRSPRDPMEAVLTQAVHGFAVAAIVACLLCHLVDPGTPEPDHMDPGPGDEQDEKQRIRERMLPDGQVWSQKWCRHCRLWRPHRCGHCTKCERCVLRLDHHCDFMGACVGERNFRFFAAFLFCGGVGINLLTLLGFHRLAGLGCWHSLAPWVHTWEPVIVVLFLLVCPCPPFCLCAAGLALTSTGVGYVGLMLADTNLRMEVGAEGSRPDGRPRARKFTSSAILDEVRHFLACKGGLRYFCGPLALRKGPVDAEVERDPEEVVAFGRPLEVGARGGRWSEPL